MDFLRKNWFWFLLVFVLFLLIIQIVGPYYLKYLERGSPPPEILTPTTKETPDNNITAPTQTVKRTEDYNGSVVRYTDKGFLPPKLKLEEKGTGFGCLLKIINETSEAMEVRLGPYEQSLRDNYGFRYPIPAGQFILLDPRFSRPTEEIINFKKPQDKISIEFGKTCVE